MTVQQASFLLFNWFKNNDYFDLDTDYRSLIKGKNLHKNKNLVECSLKAALKNLEESDLVSSVESQNGAIWVLEKKFENISQDVSISGITCQSIFKLLCESAEEFGLEATTDPLNITEEDIQTLLWLLVQKKEEKGLDNFSSLN
jgi:hypothetical protein